MARSCGCTTSTSLPRRTCVTRLESRGIFPVASHPSCTETGPSPAILHGWCRPRATGFDCSQSLRAALSKGFASSLVFLRWMCPGNPKHRHPQFLTVLCQTWVPFPLVFSRPSASPWQICPYTPRARMSNVQGPSVLINWFVSSVQGPSEWFAICKTRGSGPST